MNLKKGILVSLISVLVVSSIATLLVLTTVYRNNNSNKNEVMHTVTFDSVGGTLVEPILVKHGSKIETKPTSEKHGYTLDSWSLNGVPWNFSNDVVKGDLSLMANWSLNTYSIIYNLNGGQTSVPLQATYNVKSEFDLVRPTKEQNIFAGWFTSDSMRIDSISNGMTGDLVLNARWISNLETISLDITKGNIFVYGDETNPNIVTVRNIPVDNKYHNFIGWYDKNDNLLSKDDSYTFELQPNETNYIYSKYLNETEENEWNLSHGAIPKQIGEKISYGLYPQSVVSDEQLVNILNSKKVPSFGNMFHYNQEYYCYQNARLFRENSGELPSKRDFDDGTIIIPGNKYWFKYEPILWDILTDGDAKTLLSSKLLSVQQFNDYFGNKVIDEKIVFPNNYKESSLRKWLNNDFYNSAFVFGGSKINVTEVDNSCETLVNKQSAYSCENTFDKVFMLSYRDYYSFTPNERQCLTTDYSRSQSNRYGTDANDLYCGYYWTRSPYDDSKFPDEKYISKVNKKGAVNSDFLGDTHTAVRPAITITL